MKLLTRKDSQPEENQQLTSSAEARNRTTDPAQNVYTPQMQAPWNMDQMGQGSHEKKKATFSKNAPKASASRPFYPNSASVAAAEQSRNGNNVDPSQLSHENSQNIIQYNAQNVNFIQLSGQPEPAQ